MVKRAQSQQPVLNYCDLQFNVSQNVNQKYLSDGFATSMRGKSQT